MSTISRRAALGGLALLSGGAATIAVADPFRQPADTELLQIDCKLRLAEQRFHDACEAEESAYERWNEMRPQPDEIILAPQDYRWRLTDYWVVVDPRGKQIVLDDTRTMQVALPNYVRATLASYDGRSTTAKFLRRMLICSERFFCASDDAEERSGISVAIAAMRTAWHDVQRLCDDAFAKTPMTVEGLAVLTRAAVLEDYCRNACDGFRPDPRFVKLAFAANEIVARMA